VEAKKYMDAGGFVPDSVIDKIVRDRLNEADIEDGSLLDGEERVARLLGRAKEAGRSDDNEAFIRHRFDLYHQQAKAIVAKYVERGIITQVGGVSRIDEVTDRVMQSF
jgi:adenylate kinase